MMRKLSEWWRRKKSRHDFVMDFRGDTIKFDYVCRNCGMVLDGDHEGQRAFHYQGERCYG